MMLGLISLVGLVFAAAFEPTEATTEILLTKANIEAQDYLSVTTDNCTDEKTYGGVTGFFYNMSKAERKMTITVKNVSKFELFVQNSNAGRSYTVTVGSGQAQTINHNGGGVESSGEIETGTTDEVTITLAGDGSGSVYPVKVKVTKAEGNTEPEEPVTGPVTATWDFQNLIPESIADVNIQGTDATGTVDSDVEGVQLNVLAAVAGTNIKLQYNSQGYAQFNQNTCIQVPVRSTKDVVTVVSYPGQSKYTVGGEDATGQNTFSHTATAAEVAQGYVEIIATATAYLYSIQVVLNEPEEEPVTGPVTATWDFQNLIPASIADVNIQGADATGTVDSDVDGIKLNVLAAVAGTNIKLQYNSQGYAQFNQNTCIQVPVKSTKDVVTVVSYPGQSKYTVGGEDATGQNTFSHTATAAEVAQGYVEIIATATAYLYSIQVVLNEPEDEPIAQDVTAMWDFANNCAQLAPKAEGGTYTAETMASNVEGIEMTIVYNGGQIKNNDNSYQVTNGVEMQIPVKSTEDIVTVSGYSGYSHYTIGNNDTELTNDNTYKAKTSDVQQGYVSVKSVNNNNYINYIKVEQKAPTAAVTLDNEEAVATFPFNLGTDGQKATFSNADYWLNSKVVLGSNLFINGKDPKGQDQTAIETNGKENAAGETNAIRFVIQPKFGFTFTPTKVSFKAAKYGTDNGTLDVSWENADKTTVSLETGLAVTRDAASEYSYDVEGATPGEGPCALLINLYGLQNAKKFGLSQIVIEGVLNGTEVEVPVLESFKMNGEVYQVEDVFGSDYEATVELSKSVQMVNANNPLTDLVAVTGEVGEVTYEGDDTQCVVTIPMTAGEVSLEYVLNVVQKPDFTLTYLDTDGSVMGTQQVEKDAAIGQFAVDYNTATAEEGYKVRGWFYKGSGGQKFTTADIITGNTTLYAVATEIEVSSTSKKYTFNLTDPYFYAEDHEAFSPQEGAQCKWHDTTHGWSFYNGDKVDLLVGPKATISIALCQYGHATNILIKDAAGETLATLDGMSTTDGDVVAYNYEGEAGTLTMEMVATGESYIHYVKIVNTSETNYENDGQWFFVKAGDVSSLIDVLDVVNGLNASADAPRAFIYIPNGDYNLGTTCLTNLSGHNISLIGESMEGVIIRNNPEAEGISVTATILNTGKNNYQQDLTLKNEWDYYNIQGDGRAVCLQDKGSNTICKNVTLLSHQDTYYTNNQDGEYYWETSDIHGTVDFICGEGALFMESSTLTVEKRTAAGTGECTITAPSTKAGNQYGYVFSNCKIENNAEKYNYGRAWNNEPRCAYINTTVNDDKLVSTRWTLKGMNQYPAKEFVEYNTMNTEGTVVSPESHIVTFTAGKSDDTNPDFQTILTDEQAATFTVDNVFTAWEPDVLATQFETTATIEDNTISWTAVEGATGYAIYCDGELLDIVAADVTSYVIESAAPSLDGDANATYTIRVANTMGGLGVATEVTVADGISKPSTLNTQPSTIYDLNGRLVKNPGKGVYIINGKKVVNK